MLELVDLARRALFLAVLVSLPVVAGSAIVGMIVGALGANMNAGDSAISHLPRLLAVAAVLALAGPWMGHEILGLTTDIFQTR